MQNKASFLCLQEPTNGSYPELNELIPHPSDLFLLNHFNNIFQPMHRISRQPPLFRFPNHYFLCHVMTSSQININIDNSSGETDTQTRTCHHSLHDRSKHWGVTSQSKYPNCVRRQRCWSQELQLYSSLIKMYIHIKTSYLTLNQISVMWQTTGCERSHKNTKWTEPVKCKNSTWTAPKMFKC